jgi:hypothetical protein
VSHGLEFFWRKEEFPASVGIWTMILWLSNQ